MWISNRRSRATNIAGSRPVGVAVALLACVGLAACSAADTPSPASTTEVRTVAPLPEPAGDTEGIEAGTYLVTGFTVPFEITVPDGWQSFGWGVLKEEAGEWAVFVNFVNPGSVPADGCAWRGTFADVDQSPEAYVKAITTQTSTETTPPIQVVMGDYSGLEFDYAVERGVDITACDEERICLFAGPGATECARVHGGVNERETERALDLNGELAVIAVGQFKTVDPALTEEARAVLDSIEFAPGE